MSGGYHWLRMGGLVLVPERAELQGGLIILDGKQYMVGPAVYQVTDAPPEQYSTALGPEFEATAQGSLTPVYLPPEQWPEGLVLDNAVAVDLSEVVPTKEAN